MRLVSLQVAADLRPWNKAHRGFPMAARAIFSWVCYVIVIIIVIATVVIAIVGFV